jgi:hypothetical protein
MDLGIFHQQVKKAASHEINGDNPHRHEQNKPVGRKEQDQQKAEMTEAAKAKRIQAATCNHQRYKIHRAEVGGPGAEMDAARRALERRRRPGRPVDLAAALRAIDPPNEPNQPDLPAAERVQRSAISPTSDRCE